MQRAVQRHYEGKTRVIPIILETCGWRYSPFKSLHMLPTDGIPINDWDSTAKGFYNVEEGIRWAINDIYAERRAAEEQKQRQRESTRLEQDQQERERLVAEQRQRQLAESLNPLARMAPTKLPSQESTLRVAPVRSPSTIAPVRPPAIKRRSWLKWMVFSGVGVAAMPACRRLSDFTTSSTEPEISAEPEPTTLGPEPVVAEPETPPEPEPEPLTAQPELTTFNFETVQVNERGDITTRQPGRAEYFREALGNGVTLDMVAIPGGAFVMGSPPGEKGRDDAEGPQRTVTIPRFFMGRFQVTQAQYEAVMGENPSYFEGDNRPVEDVSWDDAFAFCKKLSQQTGRPYRLPSEAEWEYACRAGTTTPFYFGPTITTDLVNHYGYHTYGPYAAEPIGEYRRETTEVGSFPPNGFGLYDMHGNIWEWCHDVWHSNYQGAPTDGSAWREGNPYWQRRRILRGGYWISSPRECRSANRYYALRDTRLNSGYGFRVVCAVAASL
jgi:formylglycine-generating enzyme required for sulfatase activity